MVRDPHSHLHLSTAHGTTVVCAHLLPHDAAAQVMFRNALRNRIQDLFVRCSAGLYSRAVPRRHRLPCVASSPSSLCSSRVAGHGRRHSHRRRCNPKSKHGHVLLFFALAHPECVFRPLPILLAGCESRSTTVDPDRDGFEVLLVACAASIRQFVETVRLPEPCCR